MATCSSDQAAGARVPRGCQDSVRPREAVPAVMRASVLLAGSSARERRWRTMNERWPTFYSATRGADPELVGEDRFFCYLVCHSQLGHHMQAPRRDKGAAQRPGNFMWLLLGHGCPRMGPFVRRCS